MIEDNIVKYVKNRNKNPFFLHQWKRLYILLLFMFLLFSLFVFFYYVTLLNKELIEKHNIDFIQRKNVLEHNIEILDTQYIRIKNEKSIMTFISYNTINFDSMAVNNIAREVLGILNEFVNENSFIEYASVYSAKTGYVLSSKGSHQLSDSQMKKLNEYINRDNNYICYLLEENDEGEELCIFGYKLGSFDNKGMFQVAINLNKIKDSMDSENIIYNKCAIITSENVQLCDLSDEKDEINLENLEKTKKLGFIKKGSKLSFYAPVNIIGNLGVFVEYSIKHGEKNIVQLLSLGVIILIFILLLTGIISFYMSVHLYKSAEDIIYIINGIEGRPFEGDTKFNMYEETKKSISSLWENKDKGCRTEMLAEHNMMLKIIDVRRLKNTSLQLQFNAHFLFNTLNMISFTVMNIAGMKNPASQAIRTLSELLDAALDTSRVTITLKEEMDNANKYISIERVRNENFDIEWNVPKELEGIMVPKFLLQPILENSFHHGIQKLVDRKGKITINVYEKEEYVIIDVADNGTGISPEKLLKIRQQLINEEEYQLSGDNIGLCNTNAKIRLIYGQNYGCSIFSDENGTKVTINLPNTNSQG